MITIRPPGRVTPDELADGDVRRVDVLKDAFTVDTVEGGVADRQTGDGTGPEVEWERWVDRASAGFAQHRVARLDADDDAGGTDEVGEGPGRVTGAASDVEDAVAVAGGEQCDGGGPEALEGGHRCSFVKGGDQRGGVVAVVDGAEVAECERRHGRRARMIQAAES
jgi:hypothetical protein